MKKCKKVQEREKEEGSDGRERKCKREKEEGSECEREDEPSIAC